MDSAARGQSSALSTQATDPEWMRAVIEQYLRTPGAPPVEIVACKITYARRRESRSLFQYQVTLGDPTNGREWNEIVSGVAYGGRRTQRAWERVQRHHLTTPAGGGFLSRAAYVPELDLLLQVFPFDHQLLALEPLMAGQMPQIVPTLLTRFGPGEWQLYEWNAESVRYRVDLRASVRLTIRAREERTACAAERGFFAKVYPGAEEADRAWRVQRDVAAALAAGNQLLAVAPVAAYLPEERVLVQDEVRATGLPDVLHGADAEEAASAVRRAARAVAALHRLVMDAPPGRIELGRTDPARLRRTADTFRAARPDLAPLVNDVESGILAGLAALGDLPTVPVHGDLKPAHVLFDEDHVVLIDLDKFSAGEPMLDVTSMLIPLRRDRENRSGGDVLARAFGEEYFAHVPADWLQRLGPHYAWALLGEAASFGKSMEDSYAGTRSGRRAKQSKLKGNDVVFLLEEAKAVLAGRAW